MPATAIAPYEKSSTVNCVSEGGKHYCLPEREL